MIAPLRPDRYLKMAAAMRREGMGITVGFASGAAQRCPDRVLELVDELGTLTWRQLDSERINALAAALQKLAPGPVRRDHVPQSPGFRGSAGGRQPDRLRHSATQHVVRRVGAGRAPWSTALKASTPSCIRRGSPRRWTARWPTKPDATRASWRGPTVSARSRPPRNSSPITPGSSPERTSQCGGQDDPAHLRHHPEHPRAPTSPTAATPGIEHAQGDPGPHAVAGGGTRRSWRRCSTRGAFRSRCSPRRWPAPWSPRRKFDQEARWTSSTDKATGARGGPGDVRPHHGPARRHPKPLQLQVVRFAAASGSRMRLMWVIAFMDQFGDVISTTTNATGEGGMIATARRKDLRAAPDTAGKPAGGTGNPHPGPGIRRAAHRRSYPRPQ